MAAPLLLIHGAWGGAPLHWARVWEPLAARFFVLAPDLPGVGDLDAPPLPTLDAYADWLAALLAAVGAPDAWLVGNSLGAMLAWQLAARTPARGLALVNGVPPRESPALVRALASTRATRPLARALYRALSFSPPVRARAFADPARAPDALVRTLAAPPPAQLDALLDLVARGARPAPRSAAPIRLLWGASDRLPGTTGAAAQALARTLPGARLVLLPSAGHCPQLEQPAAFVDAVVDFAAAGDGARAHAQPIG
jgi:2-hydroxy-6-oxonona-2,4-dienedioate hydrolase